jgi:uncharacterized repeat protein (TIGR03837 family)
MIFGMTTSSLLQHWVIFCRVVDNHGDLGVCWRLAAQLAKREKQVTLYVDDDSALQWMAPEGCKGVEVLAWPDDHASFVHQAPAQVVIEAFACELPQGYQAAMAAWAKVPVWINLEYFSAEPVTERNHALPSPVLHGPAKGLTKWFFYPSLSETAGGVLGPGTEGLPGLDANDSAHALRISLFCYEPASLGLWLKQLSQLPQAVQLSVTAGRATQAVRLALQGLEQKTALQVTALPYLSHTDFDHMLSKQDLNLVRGEDSLVRAIWAGKAFLWQIYPQDDGAHHAKLAAFLTASQAPEVVVQAHLAWNADHAMPLPNLSPEVLQVWTDWVVALRRRLSVQTDLLTRLESFVAAHG